jgi:nitrogen fixation protein NifU and related proteins
MIDGLDERMLTEEQEIYRENILDHYKHPHNAGVLESCSFSHKEFNPLCGDEVTMFINVNGDGRVDEVKFSGKGCAISIASASLLTDHIKQKSVEEIKEFGKKDVENLLGIPLSVVRIKCALLPLKTLHKGMEVNPC